MQPQVTRSTFTTAISGREPVDQLTHIQAGQQVYYFTELSGLQGRVITHKWEKDGAFQLGMQFPVGGERWRVQSSKSISPTMAGVWTVTVLNEDGTILKQDTLLVDPSVAAPASSPTEPATPAVPTPAPAPTSTTVPSPTIAYPPTPQPAATPATETKPIWETIAH
jgi:Tfp pilus assembly protein FimV